MTRVMYRNSCSTLQDKGDRETENWEEVGLCKCCIKNILYVHILCHFQVTFYLARTHEEIQE